MPVAGYINPNNGDDLTAQSITQNVTDKIIATYQAHELGQLAAGASRHLTNQIDDAAQVESNTIIGGNVATDVYTRLDNHSRVLSDIMGTPGGNYSAKRGSMIGIAYPSIQKLSDRVIGQWLNVPSTLVARDTNGDVSFRTVNAGFLVVGTSAIQITTLAGNVDATKIAGLIPAASVPSFSGDIGNGAGGTAIAIAAGAVTGGSPPNSKLAAKTITAANIADSTITALQLATGSVDSAELVDGIVTGGTAGPGVKIAAKTITAANIADSTITSLNLLNGTILAADLADGIVSGGPAGLGVKIAAKTITAENIADATITSLNIAAGAVQTSDLGDGAVTGGLAGPGVKIAAKTITADNIVDATITTAQLHDGAVTAQKLGAGAVTANAFADYTLPPTKMLEGALLQDPAGASMKIWVNPLHRWSAAGQALYFVGGYADFLAGPGGDLRPQSGSQWRYVLVQINSTKDIVLKQGQVVGRPLVDTDRPLADPDTEPLGFVQLYFQQATITQASDITPFYGRSGAGSFGGTGFAAAGHVHGQDATLVTRVGLGEGFAHPTSVLSNTFIVDPFTYRNTAGVVRELASSTTAPIPLPGPGVVRCTPYYFDPNLENFFYGTYTEAAGATPASAAFPANVIPICYLFARSNSGVVKRDVDDGINAWLIDARVRLRQSGVGVGSPILGVNEGGTGTSSFGAGSGLIYQPTPGTTTSLSKVAAALSGSGFSFNPVITGITAGGTIYGFESQASITTGGANSNVVAGAHLAPPTLAGGGAQNAVYGAIIDGPTYGTARAGLQVNAGSTAGVGAVINNPTGTTTDIARFQVNNATVASVGNTGVVTASGLSLTGALTAPAISTTGAATGRITASQGFTAQAGGADVTGDTIMRGKAVVGAGAVGANQGLLVSGAYAGGAATAAAFQVNAATSGVAAIGIYHTGIQTAVAAGNNHYGVLNSSVHAAAGFAAGAAYGIYSNPSRLGADTGSFSFASALGGAAPTIGTSNFFLYGLGDVAVTGVSTFPSTGLVAGMTCYRADLNCWFKWDGTTWRQMGVPFLTAAPTPPYAGFRYINLTDNLTYRWTGTAWVTQSRRRLAGVFEASADIANMVLTAGNSANVGAALSFSIDDATSEIEFDIQVGGDYVPNTANGRMTLGFTIDAAGFYLVGSCFGATAGATNAFNGTRYRLPGLSATTHSLQLKAYANVTGTLLCLPVNATYVNFHYYRIYVWENKV